MGFISYFPLDKEFIRSINVGEAIEVDGLNTNLANFKLKENSMRELTFDEIDFVTGAGFFGDLLRGIGNAASAVGDFLISVGDALVKLADDLGL